MPHRKNFPLLIPAVIVLFGISSACNKDSDPQEQIVVTPASVAVKDFTLKADTKVLANLDSVFFSIDLNKGIIFNADSLPKGTNITKLIPVITFANTMSKAEIVTTDDSGKTTTIDYLENATDSIDFSRDVALNVTAADGLNTYSYKIKVNVHKELPDSMIWDKMAHMSLPSRLADPVAQKSVEKDGSVFSIIEERDHSMTLAVSSDIFNGQWTKKELALPFEPMTESLSLTSDGKFWMLDAGGMLYSSDNAETWTPTGEQWISIVGPYSSTLLGIKESGSGLQHCHYPASADVADSMVADDFPLTGRSALGTLTNKWATDPTVILTGGKTAAGVVSSHTWAFDGSSWAMIDDVPAPAMEDATLVKYVVYRDSGKLFTKIAYEAWLLIGGRLADGTLNDKIYLSLDNGVNWRQASSMMQLPDNVPQLTGADGIVLSHTLDADLTDIWTKAESKDAGLWMKISYKLDGYDISWECPYIYFLGGNLPDGSLSSEIWRGVIARLTFTPLI